MKKLFNLEGKHALVSGGGGLLGAMHALSLVNQGCTVTLADIDIERINKRVLEEGIQSKTNSIYLDVSSKDSWKEAAKQIVAEFGKIDILVNNAGFTNQSKTAGFDTDFEDFPLEAWNAIMNVNLTGTFFGCQVVGKHMLQMGKGSIINIASLYGVVSPNHRIYDDTPIKQPVAYSISKHGVVALTKYIGTLWANKGVRVNAITPGGIFNGHEGLFLERFNKLNPIGRMSRKDELMGGIAFLASDESSHVIAHNLIIDGGWTSW